MASTHHIEESVSIARPPEEVWAAIADYPFDLQWRRGITEMTPDPPGPPAPGTRVHEVLKMAGRSFTTDSTVSDVDPGISYRIDLEPKVSRGRSVRCSFRCFALVCRRT